MRELAGASAASRHVARRAKRPRRGASRRRRSAERSTLARACSSRGGSRAGSRPDLAPGTVVAPRRDPRARRGSCRCRSRMACASDCARRRVRVRARRPRQRAGGARVARREASRGSGDSRRGRGHGVGRDRRGGGARSACRSLRCVSSSTASATRCREARNNGSTSVGVGARRPRCAPSSICGNGGRCSRWRSAIASRAVRSTGSRQALARRRLLDVDARGREARS